ncbi:MAG: hypothetical protein M1826_004786 [Phylliscum demangeonii]|nr:MAG: hypothetical protein M1826_004786 [Phylliscum demangeonii]
MHSPSFVLAGLWLVAIAIHAAPTKPIHDPYIITDSEISETYFSDYTLMNRWIIAIRATETDHAKYAKKMEISRGKSPEDADRDFKTRVKAIQDKAKQRRDDASRNMDDLIAKQKTPSRPRPANDDWRPEEKEYQADLKRIEDEYTAHLVEAKALKEKERGMPSYMSPIGNTYEALETLHNDLIATAEKNARRRFEAQKRKVILQGSAPRPAPRAKAPSSSSSTSSSSSSSSRAAHQFSLVPVWHQVTRAMKPVANMVFGTHHPHRASSSPVGRISVTGEPLSAARLEEVAGW